MNDSPDHQIRVYEIHFEYPKKDFSFAGVLVKGMRGQVHNIGQREVVAKTITQQTSGEYWIEE